VCVRFIFSIHPARKEKGMLSRAGVHHSWPVAGIAESEKDITNLRSALQELKMPAT
jgi:hypothetical protein